MIIRIIRAGSSARSSKLGHVRREDVASAAEDRTAEPGGERGEARGCCGSALASTSRGVRTGTLASRIRVQALTVTWIGVGDRLGRADRGADRDRAHQRAPPTMATRVRVNVRLRRHFQSPFLPVRLCLRADATYYSRSRANPGKLPKTGCGQAGRVGEISPTKTWCEIANALGREHSPRPARRGAKQIRKGVRRCWARLQERGSARRSPAATAARRARCSATARRRWRRRSVPALAALALGGWAFKKMCDEAGAASPSYPSRRVTPSSVAV